MVDLVRVSVRGEQTMVEGLVLKWAKDRGELRALVTYERNGRVVTDWVPAMALVPMDGELPRGDAEVD